MCPLPCHFICPLFIDGFDNDDSVQGPITTTAMTITTSLNQPHTQHLPPPTTSNANATLAPPTTTTSTSRSFPQLLATTTAGQPHQITTVSHFIVSSQEAVENDQNGNTISVNNINNNNNFSNGDNNSTSSVNTTNGRQTNPTNPVSSQSQTILTPSGPGVQQPQQQQQNQNQPHHLIQLVNQSQLQLSASPSQVSTPVQHCTVISSSQSANNPHTQVTKRKETLEAKRERKAAKTLAIITGAFVVCWLPFFITALLMPLCEQCQISDTLFSFFLWLGYFNSTLNPVIYTIFSPEFRQAFKRILFGGHRNSYYRSRKF